MVFEQSVPFWSQHGVDYSASGFFEKLDFLPPFLLYLILDALDLSLVKSTFAVAESLAGMDLLIV